MLNLLPTITPKSDQLNADDLIGRSITIKVTKVALSGDADQPIAIHYEGDDGKPYKPCKSMRRVMVHVWGTDGNAYAGRRMTLYRDDKVTFGGMAVGGIRISHMSNIERDITMALTATRANRRPFTVKPLSPEQGERTEAVDLLPILTSGREAASRGSAALTAWWGGLDKAAKIAAKPTLDSELKAAAAAADQAALDDDGAAETGGAAGQSDFPGDKPTLSLAQRADGYEKRLREATTTIKLRSIYNANSGLRDDLDRSDPERGVELENLFNELFAALEDAEREAAQ